jgi:hypothetical protein
MIMNRLVMNGKLAATLDAPITREHNARIELIAREPIAMKNL